MLQGLHSFGKWSTFSKMVVLIVLLLLPVGVIYSYTYYVSVDVIEKELREKNLKRLSFFATQIDNIADQLSVMSIVASRDPSIAVLSYEKGEPDSFERVKAREAVIQKLSLMSATSSWTNRLTVILPKSKTALSNDNYSIYDEFDLQRMTNAWEYEPSVSGDGSFRKIVRNPLLLYENIMDADSVVEVRFSERNIVRMLNDYTMDGNANTFLYKDGFRPIVDREAETGLTDEIVSYLNREEKQDTGYSIAEIGHEQYMVNYVRSKSLGWYAVDYLPMKQVLAPIVHSRNLFYVSVALVLLVGVLAAVLLYRQVQVPIRLLLRGVQRIQTGEFSHRISFRPRNEFDYLFTRFNDMAEEIQRLLENVYMENIRFREAKLKHLQSQINPHFLANCMFFIKNMIAIGDKEAATAMVMNLAKYFRYITTLEHTLTTLRDELLVVENYLTIQNLRIERFHYEIDVPESMLDLLIPRLMIQPIVENAIVHSIEKSGQYGIIHIAGAQTEDAYAITIDNNGVALTDDQLAALRHKVESPLDQEAGCGLWNVHQRLTYQFDQRSGLSFSHSELGGLRVEIRWSPEDRHRDEIAAGGSPQAPSEEGGNVT